MRGATFPANRPFPPPPRSCDSAPDIMLASNMSSHAAAACSQVAVRSGQRGGTAQRQPRMARPRTTATRASVNVQPFGSPPPPPPAAAAAPDLQALQQQLEGAAQRLHTTASGVQLPGVQLPDVQLPTSVDTQQAASVAAQVGWWWRSEQAWRLATPANVCSLAVPKRPIPRSVCAPPLTAGSGCSGRGAGTCSSSSRGPTGCLWRPVGPECALLCAAADCCLLPRRAGTAAMTARRHPCNHDLKLRCYH